MHPIPPSVSILSVILAIVNDCRRKALAILTKYSAAGTATSVSLYTAPRMPNYVLLQRCPLFPLTKCSAAGTVACARLYTAPRMPNYVLLQRCPLFPLTKCSAAQACCQHSSYIAGADSQRQSISRGTKSQRQFKVPSSRKPQPCICRNDIHSTFQPNAPRPRESRNSSQVVTVSTHLSRQHHRRGSQQPALVCIRPRECRSCEHAAAVSTLLYGKVLRRGGRQPASVLIRPREYRSYVLVVTVFTPLFSQVLRRGS